MIKFIAPFKGYTVDTVAMLPPEQEAWLVSRQYAVTHNEEVALPPLQPEPPKKPLTTRKKK